MKRQPGKQSRAVGASHRNGAVRLALAGAMAIVLAATGSWAYEAANRVGLSGILPDGVPAGLGDDDFAVLADTKWKDWAIGPDGEGGVSADIYNFYSELPADAAAQRAALNHLKIKLGTMETALKDARYRVIHGTLADLHGNLSRRVAIAEAILDTLEMDASTAKAARVKNAYSRLSPAIKALERDLARISGGKKWLPYVRAEQLSRAAASNDASAEAVALLSGVQDKINGRDRLANASQKDFLGQAAFLDLEAAINDVVAAIHADPAAVNVAELRKQSQALVAALEKYEADPRDLRADEIKGRFAAETRAALNALQTLAPDGGARVEDAMRSTYIDYNIRIVASEGLMKRLMAETKTQSSGINEPISEAWVTGTSWTTTRVAVDLKPSSDVAKFDIVVDGNVQSSTTANAAQAVVYGGSSGYFQGRTPVSFDGQRFTTGSASVGVNASTYANDVDAKVFVLLRPIADLIATSEVERRKPQSDAIARQRISDQVSREMNTETRNRFVTADADLQAKLYGPLRDLNWYPDTIQLSSTDRELLARARLMEQNELGGQSVSLSVSPPASGLVIQAHESLLNNAGARLEIAGKTMSEDDLRALLEAKFTTLLGREFKFTKPEGEEAAPQEVKASKFIFAEEDPMRFEVGGGSVTLVMRTGLAREGEADIPQHIITVPLSFKVEGNEVVMTRADNVRVTPGPGVTASIVRSRIMIEKVETSIPERRTYKGEINVEQQGKKITLHITDITANDGWVTVTAK